MGTRTATFMGLMDDGKARVKVANCSDLSHCCGALSCVGLVKVCLKSIVLCLRQSSCRGASHSSSARMRSTSSCFVAKLVTNRQTCSSSPT